VWPVIDGKIVQNPTPVSYMMNTVRGGLEDLPAYYPEKVERRRAIARNEAREDIHRSTRTGDALDYGRASLQSWTSDVDLHIPLACREAYSVVSNNHIKAFRSFFSEPKTYIDFKLDTLYLRCVEIFGIFWELIEPGTFGYGFPIQATHDLRRVERLALLLNPWDFVSVTQGDDPFAGLLLPTLRLFPCLKDLVLVVNGIFSYDVPKDPASFAFISWHHISEAFTICNFEPSFPLYGELQFPDFEAEHDTSSHDPSIGQRIPDLNIST
jgi:hypothetical protein